MVIIAMAEVGAKDDCVERIHIVPSSMHIYSVPLKMTASYVGMRFGVVHLPMLLDFAIAISPIYG
jgi:hypothetical protein